MAKDLKKLAKMVIADQGRMEGYRQTREALTKKITEIFNPRRYDLLDTGTEGRRWGAGVYNDVPAKSLFKWQNAFVSATASRRLDWFNYSLGLESLNTNDDVQRWLQESRQQMRNAFERSNFYDEILPFVADGGCDGAAFMEPVYDEDMNQAMFQTQHPGDVWISRDRYGRVNRVHVKKKMTAEQAYEAFKDQKYNGRELESNLPDDLVKNATEANGNPMQEYEFLHARFKNTQKRVGSILSEDKEYLNVWVCMNNQEVVECNGVDRITLSWTPNRGSRDIYGTGLAAHALTAALMGEQFNKKLIQMASIAVEGRFKASKTLRGKFDRRPGGVTYLNDSTELLEMLNEKTRWPVSDEQMQNFNKAIEDWFWLELFLAISNIENPKDVTAFYVSQLQGEKAQVLTTTTTSFESFLDQAHEFVWDVETKAGRMPPVPDILHQEFAGSDAEIQPDYIGPLFQIQKQFLKTKPIMQGLDVIERIGDRFPSALDKVDEDELIETAMDGFDFPEKVQRTDDEVMEIREARIQAQQQEEVKAALSEGMANAPGLSKTIEKDSVIDRVLSGTGQ